MIDIQESVFIRQPVERVFEFVTDLKNNPAWQSGILETAITSQGALGIGSTYSCINRFLGIRFESAGEIVEFEPNRRCTYRFNSGSVLGESWYAFESQDGGTLLTTSGRLKLRHLQLAGFLVNRKAAHQVRNDLQKLKSLLENGSAV